MQKAMAEVDNSKQEEGETEKPSVEPPEPEISATPTIREDQVQNAVAFLSHPKVTNKLFPFIDKRPLACPSVAQVSCLFRFVGQLRIQRSLSCKRRV